MTLESLRPYLQLASGVGEMTKAKALEAAQGLLAIPAVGEASRRAVQASALADDLLETARSNRDGLVRLVRDEIETALGRADLARVADVDAAKSALARLTHEVEELRDAVLGGGRRSTPETDAGPSAVTTTRPTTPAKKATPAKKTTPTKKTTSVKKTTPAKKTAAAKKTTAAKKAAPAKKTTAKKSTAKKTASTPPAGA